MKKVKIKLEDIISDINRDKAKGVNKFKDILEFNIKILMEENQYTNSYRFQYSLLYGKEASSILNIDMPKDLLMYIETLPKDKPI